MPSPRSSLLSRSAWCGILMVGVSGCAQMGTKSSSSIQSTISAADRQLIRENFVPQPIPGRPVYVKVTQPCVFFTAHPKDGSMVPVGMLRGDSYLILRREDGEWVDVQLEDGHVGSVISTNVRRLNNKEQSNQDYLQPQPDLEPLSLPQASNDARSVPDPTLLGG